MSNHLFDLLSQRSPGADRWLLERQDGSRLSYGQFFERTGRMAQALRALGVVQGDRVAVQVEKSPEVVELFVACARAGAIFLPLNTAYTPAEVRYFLSDAEPALFVCDPARRDAMASLAAECGVRQVETLDADGRGSLAERAAAQDPAFENAACGPDDLAAILYTSGTTGRSKGAMLSHDNLASNALTLVESWRFTADDVLIHALPVFHTHGLFVATNTVLMAGAAMIVLPKFDPARVLALAPRATCLMGVPTFYTRLLAEPGLSREAVANIRLFVSGSAPLLAETHRAFQARTGHAILERYGMTETNMNTSNPYDGDRVPGTVGFPLPGVDLRVVDPESGNAMATDEVGMIEVRGPNVFKGYWRMPEKTAAEFKPDGFFITGDLGKVDPRGYVHIVGRGKDLIITGGYNVYPKEVEGEIDALPGVEESAVIGLPDVDFGEAVAAVVVRAKGSDITEDQVRQGLADRLARFKQPKQVFFLDELPRNAMGKVQKNVLRERFASPAN